MAWLYKIVTTDGVYIGKDSTGSGWYMKQHHILNTFNKMIKMNLANAESNNANEADTKAVETLEAAWAKDVYTKGFLNSSYIQSLGTMQMSNVISEIQNSMPLKSRKYSLTPFAWLEKIWRQPDFEVAEALAIMLTSKTAPKMHNTQVDFLSRPGGNVTSTWSLNTALGKDEFKRKISQVQIEIPDKLQFYRTIDNKVDKEVKMVWEALLHPKVAKQIVWHINKKEIEIWEDEENKQKFIQQNSKFYGKEGATNLYTQLLTALKTRKLTEIQKQWLSMQPTKTEAFTVLVNELAYYQPLIQNWYKNTTLQLNFHPDRQLNEYYNSLKRTIHKQFVVDFKANQDSENIRDTMLNNSVLATKWSFLKTNWNRFYAEQMSIYYGSKYGALVRLSDEPTEFGEYAFGRPKILNSEGTPKELFTAYDPDFIATDEAENMTIF